MSVNPLFIGDAAPSFPRLEFIKGRAFTAFEPGQVYVLECWATWCGPCVATFPHLTQLQQQYPQVTILGAAIWEDDINEVRQFASEREAEMGYTLAFNPAATAEQPGDIPGSWLKPSWQEGIPTAFLIDQQGRIAWFGHPMELDAPLAEVVAGTFDIERAASEYRQWVKDSMVAERKVLEKQLMAFSADKDLPGAIAACEAAFAENPGLEQVLGLEKLALMLRLPGGDAALSYARQLKEKFGDSTERLRQDLGYIIVDGIEVNPEIDRQDALLAFAADTLLEAESQAAESGEWITRCHIARSLTLVRFRQEAWQDAHQYALKAIDAAQHAGLHEDIIQALNDLAAQCQKNIPADDKPGKKVVCDGDRCWLE